MIPEPIRDAVAAEDYARASELFDRWSRSLPVTEDSLRELGALVEFVRAAVQQARAHAQARLQCLRDEINVVAAYRR